MREIRRSEIENIEKQLNWLLFLPKTRQQQRQKILVGSKLFRVQTIILKNIGLNQQLGWIKRMKFHI